VTSPSVPAAAAALEHLAAALDSAEFVTVLTIGPGRPPRLTVASRHAQISGDIYAGHRAYYWSWSERIAAITDPQAAARKISNILRAIPAARP
jgi:hypothetical protein